MGHNLTKPYGTEIRNFHGQHIFPGLISAGSTIGLQEIGAVRATRDYSEVGSMNPNVRANVSYNPDSEIIPISRSNGILLALSVPRSGLVSGISSLMMLDGWTWEDATLKHPVGLHIFWPSMDLPKSKYDKKVNKNNKDIRLESIQRIDDLFYESHAYLKLKDSGSFSYKHDLRLEGILPVIKGDIPVFVHANEIRQIEAAVYWADRQNIEMVLVGGKDSWRNTQLLKDRNIPTEGRLVQCGYCSVTWHQMPISVPTESEKQPNINEPIAEIRESLSVDKIKASDGKTYKFLGSQWAELLPSGKTGLFAKKKIGKELDKLTGRKEKSNVRRRQKKTKQEVEIDTIEKIIDPSSGSLDNKRQVPDIDQPKQGLGFFGYIFLLIIIGFSIVGVLRTFENDLLYYFPETEYIYQLLDEQLEFLAETVKNMIVIVNDLISSY